MTQHALDLAVARRTGETLSTVRVRGFGQPLDLEPEDLVLAVDCPSFGRPCRVDRGAGLAPLAECTRPACDVAYEYRPQEVYAAGARQLRDAPL